VLHRAHTAAAAPAHVAAGGKAWDTVKPLARHFGDLRRVVLIDDDAFKAAAPASFMPGACRVFRVERQDSWRLAEACALRPRCAYYAWRAPGGGGRGG
jgi:hypothetical protein